MQLPSGCRQFIRTLHVSARRQHLVGPNDPISNLRPIIYTDIQTPPKAGPESKVNHPYSLEEFSDTSSSNLHALELEFKLKREELDALNHKYWTESNERFEAAKASVLSSLPPSATSETREHALSEFYGMWVVQERERQEEYSNQWRRRNFENIVLAARVEYERLKRRIFG
ncbi:hypothetical protein EDD16DRAFT_678143 [Pisolithus croceorrhizus]|nr:hypothetical protein EV401DRAFT_2257381 [Pisolithus croceorrhizus]KAI6132210.1 hypothetical protein EDD16DRAFT_678143 [Pisolithus croceorrhizus]KAI6160054.1 hypothetical protein EDD17DRAFT_1485485 [Pisolithus thermaeus]